MRPDIPMTDSERSARAALAANKRHHPDDPATDELAASFKASRLERYIQQVVKDAPALSAEQRDRLAMLLQGGVTR